MYGPRFFDYVEAHAARSARVVVPLVRTFVRIDSVLDVGCGTGAWLRAHAAEGASEILGLDGDDVDRRRLLIPSCAFRAIDVAQPFDLGRRFDLVQSLEVAEHLPAACGPAHVANLTRHASVILFSAAVPGQGGAYHVNERPLEYWRGLFATHGFRPYDGVRPALAGQAGVAPWYAHNTILYVHDGLTSSLSGPIRDTLVPDDAAIPNMWTGAYRLRTAIVRILPVPVVTRLALWRQDLLRNQRPPSSG